MFFTFEASCGSFIGNGRNKNEDNFYFDKRHLPMQNNGLKSPLKLTSTTKEQSFFAVFDGMGGEAYGEKASCVAAEIFTEEVKQLKELVVSGKEFFYRACDKANKSINALERQLQVNSIGTTVAAFCFSQNEVTACNVGDSKLFRIRDKKMIQISEDHTDEKILASMGIEKKPVLLQYIGMNEAEMVLEPFISRGEIKSGDVYIACSDGVTDVLSLTEIYELVSVDAPWESVNQLLASVNIKNGMDNATVVVVKIL